MLGGRRARARILYAAHPTYATTNSRNHAAGGKFLRDCENASELRGYAKLRPSEIEELHRGQPSPLTALATEQE